jgi:tryptophanyl-tRNA synthetase
VPEHTELAWIFSCVASYGDLTRQIQFKEKSEQLAAKVAEDPTKGEFISVGLFNYPVLQAADILLYRAGFVPVGKDQEQHLELSRSIAKRFNYQFGEDYFPEPQVLATETPKVLSLADPTKKMSKSLGPKHYIGLFEDEKSVRSKVKSAVTDTGAPDVEMSPGVDNLLGLLRACNQQDKAQSFATEYASGGQRRYAPLKEAVADALVELTSNLRVRRDEIAKDREQVRKTMWDNAQKAHEIAAQTIKDVRRLAGLPKR